MNKETYDLNAATYKLNVENRKNALREHLYKEQIEFFKILSKQIVVLYYHFDDAQIAKNWNKAKDDLIEQELDKLDRLFDENMIVHPNDHVFDAIHNVIIKANDLLMALINLENNVPDKTFDSFFDSYAILVDVIRDFANIEELGEENKKTF